MDDICEYISGLCEVGDINEGIYKDLMDKLKVVNDKKDKYIKVVIDRNIVIPTLMNKEDIEEDPINSEGVIHLKNYLIDINTSYYIKVIDGCYSLNPFDICDRMFRFHEIYESQIAVLKKSINKLIFQRDNTEHYTYSVVIKSVEEL